MSYQPQFRYKSQAMWFLVVLCISQGASAFITFDCAYSERKVEIGVTAYICEPKVNQYGKTLDVTGISQNHMTGKSNQDVNALFVEKQRIDAIPRGINSFFDNLKVLGFDKCPIKSLTKDDLRPFPNS